MASSKLLWAVVLGSFLVVAAVSVPVSGMLLGHGPLSPASTSPRNGGPAHPVAPPSNNSSVYPVTFSETGLPGGTEWTVHVVGARASPSSAGPTPAVAPAWFGGQTNSSNTSAIGFELSNGTYHYAVPGVRSPGTFYVASPSVGSFSVNGSSVSVGVTFAPIVLHTVTFSETGLPAGTPWSVNLFGGTVPPTPGNASSAGPAPGHGSFNESNGTTVNLTVPNGNYSFFVPNASASAGRYVPSPSTGTVVVNGANVTVPVAFTLVPNFELTFVETGLPAGTWWSVALAGVGGHGPGGNWSGPQPACGSSQFNGSNTSTVGFTVPNGNYTFLVWNVSNGSALYLPTPASGAVTVDGADVTVDVTFAALSLYTVTFAETGLPAGTWWSVALANGTFGPAWNASNNSTVNFTVANGTHAFLVFEGWNASGPYVPTPMSGNVTVDGASVTVKISFAVLVTYTVTFVESGLPSGTSWYAAVGAGWGGWAFGQSNTTTLTFALANGTYGFSIGPVWAGSTVYAATPSFGTVTVDGSAVTVDVSFAEV